MTTSSMDELLDQAFLAFNANNMRLAETLCREAMTIMPTHGDALYLLGLIAYREKALTVAADLLHEALDLYPDIQNYQLAYAEVLRAQGYLDEALSYYSKQKCDPRVQTEMGLIYLAQGKRKLAKEYFQQALKVNETISSAYLGLVSLATKKKERENLLLKAYSVEANENTGYHLARFYVGQKAWKKAETILKNYLIFSRDWTLYAAVLEGLKLTDEAMNALQKAIELDSYNSGAWVQKGLLLEHQKNWEGAIESYQKALALDNAIVVAHEGLSNALMAQGNFPMALEHTRYIIQQNPNHFPSLYKLAILLEETKDYEEALGLYFKLLVLKPNKVGLERRIKECIVALAQSKKHLAKKFAKGWMISFPKSEMAVKTWNMLKVILFAVALSFSSFGYCGYNEEQESLIWDMRHADFGDAISQFNVAKVYEEGKKVPKNIEKAIMYYQKAAMQGHVGANMSLGRIYEKTNSIKRAISYYTNAAKSGYIPAQLIVSRYFDNQGELKQALDWLKKALSQMFPGEKDFSRVSPEYKNLIEKINRSVQ